MVRGLSLVLAVLAGCLFDSSGLVLHLDGRRPDFTRDRLRPGDATADRTAPVDGHLPLEAKPPPDRGPDKPPPPRCAAWGDWKCMGNIVTQDCTATCNDGKSARSLQCTTIVCSCTVGTNVVGCTYQWGLACQRCEDALNDGCCRP